MDPRRQLPPIHRLLEEPALGRLIGLYGRGPTTIHLRRAVEARRREVAAGGEVPAEAPAAAELIVELAARTAASLDAELGRPLARVLNATGVLVHTNLGRAPLPAEVAAALPPLLSAGC
ncbi:MAG TPA: hypothetical protein VHM02_00375, partial [Thermoanaerobaculia bacterium]|nr:hypothetical protein [Thermoanaerobaculia bacterium]